MGKTKPNRYWQKWENVENELKIVIEQIGHFPVERELKRRGMSSLGRGIQNHGGFHQVRRKMGYETIINPKNYWRSWENVKKELLEAIEDNGGEFPNCQYLAKKGYSCLSSAMSQYHGGVNAVRKKLGMGVVIEDRGYYRIWENVEREIKEVIEKNRGKFPSQAILRARGYGHISRAVLKYHEGFPAVRERMGYQQVRVANGYWKDWENVEKRLLEIIEENNGEFPIIAKRKGGVYDAIFKYHGGIRKVRERMGYNDLQKPSGYWKDWDNFEREMNQVIEENDGEFPTQKRLTQVKRYDLLNQINKNYGGLTTVRERMGYSEIPETERQSLLEVYVGGVE